ncbi:MULTISPECIES: CTB family bacteriocin [unclassified Tolypothrix]|uniref:CTB family bacteriocin n=1 Tax=unclassified Tolypothrix TaxID=2649714 RepID=UPI0005EAC7DC|nr:MULTISPECIES: CTB family bacteriocin [unclassified Tolypothrix]BAY89404.1 hypothetical protein NIES3275_14070 [Microchaete diplosiphon NIES-3275]EKF01884.1 hypothetical protein FDUTEX481_07490 [Tolypothrix sp. PCC 7601]MBE9088088.1 CTB family bacteriocin [Tolypothrix sp. LEGE 11397]UYD23687.1 CTB family bacteriocin [Tolypothrix sp. PCC 7712]UYD34089.1 CTB family bacteriocin [Tolypothrix sp. PCC 7601]
MSDHIQPQELSSEELDNVAGGASRRAEAFTAELTDFQITTLEADRNGVRSKVFQSTDDFKAALFEEQTTGK